MSVVEQETTNLYHLLQTAVDGEIQEVGFMPDATTYGMQNGHAQTNDNHSHRNGQQTNANGYSPRQNGNTHQRYSSNGNTQNGHDHPRQQNSEVWNCTDGQKGLILRVVNENKVPKDDVEQMAQQMFGIGVRQLDKMQASGLIEELLEKVGKKPQRGRWQQRQPVRQ